MKALFAIAIAFVACPPVQAEIGDERLEREAEEAFGKLAPVGMAVAVVRPDRPVWLRGYGSLAVDGSQTVEADTVFPIHSMTKSFTAAALALLVDEGKLAWSDPVQKHIPEFAMSDPYVSEHLTVRDLLVHNSGLALGAGDLLHWPDQVASTQEFIAALRHLPLDQGFREGFAYDNILYIVAGEIVARSSGASWGEFVRTRIFGPLGMTSCSTSSIAKSPFPQAIQHSRAPGGAPVPRDDITILDDPAGSISCSVRDIARWTQFQLGDGTLADGSVFMTPEQLREMHKPVVALEPSNYLKKMAGSHFNDVALGWFASDFAGTLALEHGGVGPGGMTNMILLPEKDVAVIVLVNDLVPAHFLSYRIADLVARDEKAADWIGYIAERQKSRAQRSDAGHGEDSLRPANAAAPSRPLSEYAGTYRDPWYGEIDVRVEEGALAIHFTRSKLLNGPLLPWDGETFIARWPDRSLEADALVTFDADESGRIASMKLVAQSDRTDFSYDYHHLSPVRVSR